MTKIPPFTTALWGKSLILGWPARTPPIETFRALISEATTSDADGDTKVIEIDDVSRAVFEADAARDVRVAS